MEELQEDGVYFILKSGLSSRISLNIAQNAHHGDDNDERSELSSSESSLTSKFTKCENVKEGS